MNSTKKLESVIQQLRQAEQKVVFVREAVLSLQQPTLAHLEVLREYQLDAYSEHLEAITCFPGDAIDQQEDEGDRFEELYKDVTRVMAKKYSAAKRSCASPSDAAGLLIAEAWLKHHLDTWESLEVDVPEQLDEVEEARVQNLELKEVSVAETPSEFGTDSSRTRSSNQLTSNDSQSMEEPANNLSADVSDSTDVANRRPQRTCEEANQWADPVDHQASTESQKDVATVSSRDQLATNPCLDHVEGGSKAKPGPDPTRTPAISEQSRPGRVHLDSGHEVKAVEVCNPQLPSMMKAPDKCGHSCSCRFHPDYGANPRNDPSGQPGRSQQPHERHRKVWHPTVPPDKTAPSKANKDQLPDMPEGVIESPQPGGVCSVSPKWKTPKTNRAQECAPSRVDSERASTVMRRYCRSCQRNVTR